MSTLTTGTKAEELASTYLQKSDLQILHRNYRCQYGEIDIIAQDNADLVFIEVRYRGNNRFGTAAESITRQKQQKLVNAANFYLQSRLWAQTLACRFDVVALQDTTTSTQIEWIKDAFHA